MQTILILCIGNICRSPMAEGLLKQALPNKTIVSAGLDALVGHAADPFAIQVMQQEGLDISSHRAQSVSSRLISEADLILTMDLEQKRHVEKQYAGSKGKVFRLGEFKKNDIGDPYRQGIEKFRVAFDLIREGLDEMTSRVLKISHATSN